MTSDPTQDLVKKVIDFKYVMSKVKEHGDPDPAVYDDKICDNCKSSVCKMIQDNNDLICHEKYNFNYNKKTLEIINN